MCYFLPIFSELISEIVFEDQLKSFGIKVPIAVSIIIAVIFLCIFMFSEKIRTIFKYRISGIWKNKSLIQLKTTGPFIFHSSIGNIFLILSWIIITAFPSFYLRQLTYQATGVGGNWQLHESIAIMSILIFGFFLWVAIVQEWSSQ